LILFIAAGNSEIAIAEVVERAGLLLVIERGRQGCIARDSAPIAEMATWRDDVTMHRQAIPDNHGCNLLHWISPVANKLSKLKICKPLLGTKSPGSEARCEPVRIYC
jgi:hypothetical protein